MSRKDQAKIDYLNSPEGKALGVSVLNRRIPLSQVSDEVLPDDFEFDGWKVVSGGKFCKTAGEYKAALDKADTDMGGWSW